MFYFNLLMFFFYSMQYDLQEELIVANELQDKAKIAKAHRMIGEVKVALSDHDKALKHTLKYCGNVFVEPIQI